MPANESTRNSNPAVQRARFARAYQGAQHLVFWALTFYLLLALLGYHPDDPGWSNAGSDAEVHNSMGHLGAWLADMILWLSGYPGYLSWLVFAWLTWSLCASGYRPFARLPGFSMRLFGLLLLSIGVCALAAVYLEAGLQLPPNVGGGGVLGRIIESSLHEPLGTNGYALVMCTLILAGLTLCTGIRWLELMDTIGGLVWLGGGVCRRWGWQLVEQVRRLNGRYEQSLHAGREPLRRRTAIAEPGMPTAEDAVPAQMHREAVSTTPPDPYSFEVQAAAAPGAPEAEEDAAHMPAAVEESFPGPGVAQISTAEERDAMHSMDPMPGPAAPESSPAGAHSGAAADPGFSLFPESDTAATPAYSETLEVSLPGPAATPPDEGASVQMPHDAAASAVGTAPFSTRHSPAMDDSREGEDAQRHSPFMGDSRKGEDAQRQSPAMDGSRVGEDAQRHSPATGDSRVGEDAQRHSPFMGDSREGEDAQRQSPAMSGSREGEDAQRQSPAMSGSREGEDAQRQSPFMGDSHVGEDAQRQSPAMDGSHVGEDAQRQSPTMVGSHVGEDAQRQSPTMVGSHVGEDAQRQSPTMVGSREGEDAQRQSSAMSGSREGEDAQRHSPAMGDSHVGEDAQKMLVGESAMAAVMAGEEPPIVEGMEDAVPSVQTDAREDAGGPVQDHKEGPATDAQAPGLRSAAPLPGPVATDAHKHPPPAAAAPLEAVPPHPAYEPPGLDLLDAPADPSIQASDESMHTLSEHVETRLGDFGVKAQVVAVQPGPVVTRYELQPAPGVKGSQVTNLSKDLARSLSVNSVRVAEVIPGKSVIGLEIPNRKREMVSLSEILASSEFRDSDSALTLALGKDIGGKPQVMDLGRMPHLLVAGTTGSGKSVALNAMILSLLYNCTPQRTRLILIDPKMLELSIYGGIPHLLAPVVTDMKLAANALRWCVGEMERRYRLMATLGVRNLEGYHRHLRQAQDAGQVLRDPQWQPDGVAMGMQAPELGAMPYIVVVIDELADLMMITGKKVEELIARLAQKARAAGIHLVLATQRPSVDVITGLIKANIPSRIAFQVSSKIDSRTVLDQMGAETLLGHGDMLFLPPGSSVPIRIHGAFVSDEEVQRVTGRLRTQEMPADYREDLLLPPQEQGGAAQAAGFEEDADPLYDEAVQVVLESRRASISYVQRRLKIGYNRAARLIEEMERAGLVGPQESSGNREVLVPASNSAAAPAQE